MRGFGLKGHGRITKPLGSHIPGCRRSPSGGWDVSCKCGWKGGVFNPREIAHKIYSVHIKDCINNGFYKCVICKLAKSIGEMRKDYRYMCLRCFSKKGNQWSKNNPERTKIYKRNHHLIRRYGITLNEERVILKRQKYKCAICLQDLESGKHHVDHCHSTSKVRGVLCINCNLSIGGFKDNVAFLRSAIRYLEK